MDGGSARVLVVARGELAERLTTLFRRAGFEATASEDEDAVRIFASEPATGAPSSAAAVVDLRDMRGVRLLAALVSMSERPVLVAIVDHTSEMRSIDHIMDAGFAPPLDPSVIVQLVIDLIARRRTATGRLRAIRRSSVENLGPRAEGNSLFRRIVEEVETFIHPASASAIVDQLCREFGVDPLTLDAMAGHRMLATGRFAAALAPYAPSDDVAIVVKRVLSLLDER